MGMRGKDSTIDVQLMWKDVWKQVILWLKLGKIDPVIMFANKYEEVFKL